MKTIFFATLFGMLLLGLTETLVAAGPMFVGANKKLLPENMSKPLCEGPLYGLVLSVKEASVLSVFGYVKHGVGSYRLIVWNGFPNSEKPPAKEYDQTANEDAKFPEDAINLNMGDAKFFTIVVFKLVDGKWRPLDVESWGPGGWKLGSEGLHFQIKGNSLTTDFSPPDIGRIYFQMR